MDIERIEPPEPEFILRVTREELAWIKVGLAANHSDLWNQIREALGPF